MYRNKLEALIKSKGYTYKRLSDESGVSVDTISRIKNPKDPINDSPTVKTMEDICKALCIDLWELFYDGDQDFLKMKAEIDDLRNNLNLLIAENTELKDTVQDQLKKIDYYKDEIIDLNDFYNKRKQK